MGGREDEVVFGDGNLEGAHETPISEYRARSAVPMSPFPDAEQGFWGSTPRSAVII
jgi:hypothetical protein